MYTSRQVLGQDHIQVIAINHHYNPAVSSFQLKICMQFAENCLNVITKRASDALF